jgi:RNA polymerase sigma-70 factor (ECF subfamily)
MTDPLDRVYDQLLVVRCQADDAAAFAELVARFGPRLRYFLRSLVGDREAAEDELQNTWLEVYRGLGRLADPAAFPAWAYRIARGRAALRLRRRDPPAEPIADVPDPGGEAFAAEDAAAVHAALGKLPPEQREVLVLRFMDGLSYDAIAGVVGVPVGTVRSRLHFGKKALRTIIQGGKSDG